MKGPGFNSQHGGKKKGLKQVVLNHDFVSDAQNKPSHQKKFSAQNISS
jgi:hypothetical protein